MKINKNKTKIKEKKEKIFFILLKNNIYMRIFNFNQLFF